MNQLNSLSIGIFLSIFGSILFVDIVEASPVNPSIVKRDLNNDDFNGQLPVENREEQARLANTGLEPDNKVGKELDELEEKRNGPAEGFTGDERLKGGLIEGREGVNSKSARMDELLPSSIQEGVGQSNEVASHQDGSQADPGQGQQVPRDVPHNQDQDSDSVPGQIMQDLNQGHLVHDDSTQKLPSQQAAGDANQNLGQFANQQPLTNQGSDQQLPLHGPDKLTLQEGSDQQLPLQQGSDQQLPLQQGSNQQVPLQQGSNQQLPLQQGSNQQLPLQQVSNQQVPLQQGSNQQLPLQQSSNQQLPLQQVSNQQLPLQEGSNQQLPLQKDSNQQLPLQQGSNQQLPLQQGSNQQLPLQQVSDQQLPLQEGSNQQLPLQKDSNQQLPLQQGSNQQLPLQQGSNQQLPLQEGSNQQLPLQQGSNQQLPLQQGTNQQLPPLQGSDKVADGQQFNHGSDQQSQGEITRGNQREASSNQNQELDKSQNANSNQRSFLQDALQNKLHSDFLLTDGTKETGNDVPEEFKVDDNQPLDGSNEPAAQSKDHYSDDGYLDPPANNLDADRSLSDKGDEEVSHNANAYDENGEADTRINNKNIIDDNNEQAVYNGDSGSDTKAEQTDDNEEKDQGFDDDFDDYSYEDKEDNDGLVQGETKPPSTSSTSTKDDWYGVSKEEDDDDGVDGVLDKEDEDYSDPDIDQELEFQRTHKKKPVTDNKGEEFFYEDMKTNFKEGVVQNKLLKNRVGLNAPSSMVLFYTWIILIVLIAVVSLSAFRYRCKGVFMNGSRNFRNGNHGNYRPGEENKRLLENVYT